MEIIPLAEQEIIFPDSEKAATFRKVEGWVSRTGYFYNKDEDAARWAGATHVRCSVCGAPADKLWTVCDKCRKVTAEERYKALPSVGWNEVVPVYSMVTNLFYETVEAVWNEHDSFNPVALQLILCEPIYAKELDIYDYLEGLGIDEMDYIDQQILDAFKEFNDKISQEKIVLGYEPGNKRIK